MTGDYNTTTDGPWWGIYPPYSPYDPYYPQPFVPETVTTITIGQPLSHKERRTQALERIAAALEKLAGP